MADLRSTAMSSLHQWTAFLASNADLGGIEASHVAESRAPSRSACSDANASDDGGLDGPDSSKNNSAAAGLNFLIDQPGALAIVR
ncbi:unnamed protein product [Macrosiphum euphorbiae]|uniref:Uncharacterized protein n=1 Tax=Macrosiphum euphorbiae TaxID=13131 RepID=A0AAV0Y699_9HEMI|nr:unnamed protein product [Macrosiphum euphorbiae]CAI6376420.1 unnamed protein product [Macrosiphum euphorbiae]